MDTATLVGFFAAFCTSVSYVPQLKKCWETGKAEDLSLMMFSVLATGVAAWIVYGIFKQDIVIIIANALSLSCLAGILWFKLREDRFRRSSQSIRAQNLPRRARQCVTQRLFTSLACTERLTVLPSTSATSSLST